MLYVLYNFVCSQYRLSAVFTTKNKKYQLFAEAAFFAIFKYLVINTDLARKTTPNFPGGCANLLLTCCIIFIPELLRSFEISSTFAKRKGVYELIYKSCKKRILYISYNINIAVGIEHKMLLQISIVIYTDREMSHFLRVGVFN